MVDAEVAALGSPGGVLGGLGGHEPRDGFGDETVGRGGADLVGVGRDLGVDEGGGFAGQSEGGFGDPAGPPHR